MARPPKQGLDFWTLDVDAYNDDKLIDLALRGGERALLAWHFLMAELYRVGCCYRWDDSAKRLMAYRYRMQVTDLTAAVDAMLEAKIFDQSVYAKTGYLTSKGIQRRYFFATTRRQGVRIPDGVLLVEAPKGLVIAAPPTPPLLRLRSKESKEASITETPLPALNNSINVDNNSIPAPNNTRMTVRKTPPGWRDGAQKFGDSHRVWLSVAEYDALCAKFGPQLVHAKITHLDASIENNLKKYTQYTNHAACIRNWCTSDIQSGKAKPYIRPPVRVTPTHTSEQSERPSEEQKAQVRKLIDEKLPGLRSRRLATPGGKDGEGGR